MAIFEISFLFITLFCLCSPFKVLFSCGKENEFPENIVDAFQSSLLERRSKLNKTVHFLPITMNDFVNFLFIISKLERRGGAGGGKENLEFNTIYEFSKSFHSQNLFSPKSYANFKQTLNVNLLHRKELSEPGGDGKTQYDFYAKVWQEINYLYPVCFTKDFSIQNEAIATGGTGICYKIENFKGLADDLSFKITTSMIYKCFYNNKKVSLPLKGFTPMPDLKELKWSLFFELHKCPYIHLLICLVIDSNSIVSGYLSEMAEFGSLGRFLSEYKLSGNYRVLLIELLHISTAIHYLHQQKLLHTDIRTDNILVFQEGNEISMKLTDFGDCCTFHDYKLDNEFVLEKTRKEVLEIVPQLHSDDYYWNRAIIRMDWIMFTLVLSKVIEITQIHLPRIQALIRILRETDYWIQHDVYQTVEQHFEEEINSCDIGIPFRKQKYEKIQ